jgi:hypothetical protein
VLNGGSAKGRLSSRMGAFSVLLVATTAIAAIAPSTSFGVTPTASSAAAHHKRFRGCGRSVSQETVLLSAMRNVPCALAHKVDRILHRPSTACFVNDLNPCSVLYFICYAKRKRPEGLRILCVHRRRKIRLVTA